MTCNRLVPRSFPKKAEKWVQVFAARTPLKPQRLFTMELAAKRNHAFDHPPYNFDGRA
jgi:hypothetical protein